MTAPGPDIFGTAPDGTPVLRVVVQGGGTRVSILTWGASLQAFHVAGLGPSIVLGSPAFSDYLGPLRHSGAIVGRVANRIALGRAPLGAQTLTLERNEHGRTCLHGGSTGSGLRNWGLTGHSDTSATLGVRLGAGEGGFPGTLDITAHYALGDDGALTLTLRAETDAPTFCNLASHGYWSLDPDAGLSTHRLWVAADQFLPVDADKIPLGSPAPVSGTRFDFCTARPVWRPGDAPLDHNFCLRPEAGVRPVCRLSHQDWHLGINTDAPGLHLYDGAHLDTYDLPTPHGRFRAHAGLAIEPQYWPDAPNHPDYPDIRLNPGEVWQQTTRFHAYRDT